MITALWIGAALAGGGGSYPDFGEDRVPPSVSITIAPLRLADEPVLEGMLEVRASKTRSFAVTGSRPLAGAAGMGGQYQPVELGFQVREYVAGDFGSGIALGARASFTAPNLRSFEADRARIGPFLAAKVTLSVFTFEARGGPVVQIDQRGPLLLPAVDLSAGVSF